MDIDEKVALLARGYTREQIAGIEAARKADEPVKADGRRRKSD